MSSIKKSVFCICLIFSAGFLFSQEDSLSNIPVEEDKSFKKSTNWFENFAIRGYVQARYNRLLETNENLSCEQCDRSWGGDGGFFLRRIRVIFFGQIHKQVYFYIQPDFASNASSERLHFAQIRDAYFDVGLDKDNEYRIRIGQSKIPYGFENLQSSGNRIPLDRNDGINSAIANERDLGIFFYWAPKKYRELFSTLVRSGLKGSGDYGLLGFGFFNGQNANNPEANDKLHTVARFTYPFKIKDQIVETSIQAYTGKYVLQDSNLSSGVILENPDMNYLDERIAATFVLYPQPFGIQAEYNIGRGPEFNPNNFTIETQSLQGGYAQLSYKKDFKKQTMIPFVRYQYYDGGKKHELDARSYTVNDFEFGLEHQFSKNFELVANYTLSKRRFEDFENPNNEQEGGLFRLQAQINF